LQDGQKQATALREAGYTERAEKALQRVAEKNEQVITTFQQHFAYCNIYFFYGKDTRQVLAGAWEAGMVFDSLHQQVEWQAMKRRSFMVAEIGQGHADWLPTRGGSGEIATGAGTNSFDALVLYDHKMQPYRQIYYGESCAPAVERLEIELKKYMQRPLSLYELNSKKN